MLAGLVVAVQEVQRGLRGRSACSGKGRHTSGERGQLFQRTACSIVWLQLGPQQSPMFQCSNPRSATQFPTIHLQ